ncbi:MAG: RidA family protein [Acidobacteria bacterium]|nr:RidA family protein [Acidobacteriota bacterium]
MLIHNPRGNYSFLKGISPYSAGAIAAAGYEVVHARFLRPLPLQAGFDAIARRLEAQRRPRQALCGIELRSPRPFTFQGFADFNRGYIEILKSWDIFLEGVNPVARTNVAPEVAPPSEPALYAFSYTAAAPKAPRTFVIAGAGELPEGSLDPHDVIRRGEISPDAITAKARYVLSLMEGRIRGLGATWADVTAAGVYTVHEIHPLLEKEILPRLGSASVHGVTWHYARPPIVSIEFEMDLRGCRREIVLG